MKVRQIKIGLDLYPLLYIFDEGTVEKIIIE